MKLILGAHAALASLAPFTCNYVMLGLVSQVHGKNEERPSETMVSPTHFLCFERLLVEFFEQTGITKMNDLDFSAS